MLTALKGNILCLPELGEVQTKKNGYLVLEDGKILGVFDALPKEYAAAAVTDYGDRIITQSFSDMHLHAPQYPMLGMGLDLPLIEWLNTYTFKTESRFSDDAYARRVYRKLAAKLIANGTTHVVMFSSLHRRATRILMEELERAGVCGYVGKVNMDRNGAAELQETTEESKRETLLWLDDCKDFKLVKPIVTPRFTPSCTDELMDFLGKLANERDLPVQSHLSENLSEIAWVKDLHPDCGEYWETYDKYGLFKERTVMAHCVHSSEKEIAAMRDHGVVIAHCPESNISICSGFPKIRKMLDQGAWVTLGSDIAGGAELPMMKVITSAIRMSNAVRITSDWQVKALTVQEAAYLGTTSAEKYFGLGGGFAAGDPLHAIVIDDSDFAEPTHELTIAERYERFLYIGTEKDIAARYSEGVLRA